MSLLDTLQPHELVIANRFFQPVVFAQGACLMEEGDPGDGCYLIDSGEVRLELTDVETDSDGVLGYVGPGMFLGEFSLLDEQPRSASAYAQTPVAARWLARSAFDDLCTQHPSIGITLSRVLGQNLTGKLRHYTRLIGEQLFAGEIDAETNALVAQAVAAQQAFAGWPEARVDLLLKDIAETIAAQAEALAAAHVAESGMGVVADKVKKIRFTCAEVYRTMAGQVSSGPLRVDTERLVTDIASPMGVVLGIIPVTNCVATIVFKVLCALKARNALVLSCHHKALGVGGQTGELIHGVLERHGAPRDLVQWIRQRTSRRKTAMLMTHPKVAFILATGGPSIVKAAYSSGTPAIGVGAGNAPVWICADADIAAAAEQVIQGKSFDNGIICGSENNLVVDAEVRDRFVQALAASGAAVLTPEEKQRFTATVFDSKAHLQHGFLGRSAALIAQAAGVERAYAIRLIVVPASLEELPGPYGREKLAPILSLFTVEGDAQGLEICKRILENQGAGHTAVIHTRDQERAKRFGLEMPASRILVNVMAALGCLGGGTGLLPSFTLGCGTFGGNSTTDNVGYTHLLNIKRLALSL